MRRKERGFTLVEVVLAVAIAVLVSISAASVILATRTTSRNTSFIMYSNSQADNILECFKASSSMNQFKKALEFAYLTATEENPDPRLDHITPSGTKCDFYLYFGENGKLSVTDTVWNTAYVTTKDCAYFAAVHITNLGTSETFQPTTKLDVVVYQAHSTYTGEPDYSDVATDSNVIYHLGKVEYGKE